MRAALVVSHGRMAPCFAGVDLQIVGDNVPPQVSGQAAPQASQAGGQADLDGAEVLSTHGWHPLGWGRELMRHDVGLLLCAGIASGTWAAIQGHGIEVIPNAMGDADTVLAAWRGGHLTPPRLWPAYPSGFNPFAVRGFGGSQRGRFRGGRG
jgi:hypothetical protein